MYGPENQRQLSEEEFEAGSRFLKKAIGALAIVGPITVAALETKAHGVGAAVLITASEVVLIDMFNKHVDRDTNRPTMLQKHKLTESDRHDV